MARVAKDIQERLKPLAAGFGKRVDYAASLVGDRKTAAAAMGLSHDQLGKISQSIAVPSFPAIAALSRASGCSFEWLAFGDGNPTQPSSASSSPVVTTNYDALLGDAVLVSRYDVRPPAGPAAPGGDDRFMAALPFSRRYLEEVLRCALEDVAIGQAAGDSMEPTIGDGDLLMVHLKRKRISDGHIFVLRLADELVVKRVQRELDGSLILMSDNKAYADRRLKQGEADRVDVIGLLIWSGGPV